MILRAYLKTGLAGGLRWSGADRFWRAVRGGAPWVVGYHRVVEDYRRDAARSIPGMLISRPMLERQLDWIGRRFRPASLHEVGARLETGARSGPPLAAVTFDDGYRDVHRLALPLLRRKGIPAAVFLVTGITGGQSPPLHDRLFLLLQAAFRSWKSPGTELAGLLRGVGIEPQAAARCAAVAPDPAAVLRLVLAGLPAAAPERIAAALAERVRVDARVWEEHLPLTWDMVAELRRAGFVIGSHTRTHRLLARADGAAVRDEVEGSRRDLETRLGEPVRHFAYPGGWFDGAAVSTVAAAGYRYAYTTCRHRDRRHPLLTIPRTFLWERAALDARGRFSPLLMGWQVPGPLRVAGPCGPAHAAGPGRAA
jgi:peptidoglycan/xylan/chitin deacetylase (PgdA/CDA1 family)